nr:hypothetical protein [Solirubrobacterales bacterium]
AFASSPSPAAGAIEATAAPANGNGHPATVTVAAQGEGVALDLDSLRAVWPAVLETVMSENALCAALIADAVPIAVDGPLVTIAFAPSDDFHRRKADDDGYRCCVAEAVRTVTGCKAQISYVLSELPATEQLESAADAPPTENEWVRRFVAEFDAEEIIAEPGDQRPSSESEAS